MTVIIVLLLLVAIFAALLIDWDSVLRKTDVLSELHNDDLVPQRQPILQRLRAFIPKKRVVAEPMWAESSVPEEVVQKPSEERAAEKPSPLDGLFAEADAHMQKGEVKAAEQLYLQAAATDPTCAKAYARLGAMYMEAGESLGDAEEAFVHALKYDPENGFVLNNLGKLYYRKDRFTDAIRMYESSVRIDEKNASRHADLGEAYMAIRQYAKAESSFKKALKLEPNNLDYKDLMNEAVEKKQAHRAMLRR